MGRRKKQKFSLGEHMPEVESSVKRGVFIVLVFLVAILSLLSIFDLAGSFGRYFYQILKLLFGWGFWIFPVVLVTTGYLSLKNTYHSFENISWVGMFLLIIGYSGFFHLTQDPETFREILNQGIGGGYIGFGIAMPLFKIMGRWAAMAVTLAIFLIGLMLLFNQSVEELFARISLRDIKEKTNGVFSKFNNGDEEDVVEDEEAMEKEEVEFEEREVGGIDGEDLDEGEDETKEGQLIIKKKIKKEFPKIDLPLSLLNTKAGKPTSDDIKGSQLAIKKTLANFGIEIEMGEYSVGPTVTQYTFRPADGVKLSRIIGLGNNLALALAAHSVRIEAPIPGKSLVGIEVPNKKIAIVPLRQILESKTFKERSSNLTLVLGHDVAGQPWVADLTKLPHLLVAGQTGSGKTVCLNSLIISLLYQNQPDELKLILVDPKRVDMPVYNGIPHLLTPVIVEPKKIINALKWTINEMNRRFTLLNNMGKKNIHSYNTTHPKDKLPYIVFIIDELAQLMGVIGAELEAGVVSLAQMGRAAGIHLILATQRPSVDIITGVIKANISGRIAFSVASLTDSRTILDYSGAEKLIGNGDMLFKSDYIPKPKRLQGAFCSDRDIEDVVDYLKQKATPDYDETVVDNPNSLGLGGLVSKGSIDLDDNGDELLEEARDLIVKAGKASASYLQRRLKVGYARAARMLDILEDQGIIGPADGSKPREVLIKLGEESLVEQADRILETEEETMEDEEIMADEEEEEDTESAEEEIDTEDIEEEKIEDEDSTFASASVETTDDEEATTDEEDIEDEEEDIEDEEEEIEDEEKNKYNF